VAKCGVIGDNMGNVSQQHPDKTGNYSWLPIICNGKEGLFEIYAKKIKKQIRAK
jgi:hypothetical protein